MPALECVTVDVDDDVAGQSLSIGDLDELAKLIAVIALGQSDHAVRILRKLEPAGPALTDRQLFVGARSQMRIRGDTEAKREVSAYHRDGFLFECISWIAARTTCGDRAFMKDPHISSTSQGLDGLLVEMHPDNPVVIRTVIFEDKCTESPRDKFRDEVLPTFKSHHESARSRELVAAAVTLIKQSGLNGTEATRAAANVLDKSFRTYRAALTIGPYYTTPAKQKDLFKGYGILKDIQKAQRVGVTFTVEGALREWFQALADKVIKSIDEFEVNEHV